MRLSLAAAPLGILLSFLPAQDPAPDLPPLLGDHLEPTSALAREHVHHAGISGLVLFEDGSPAVGATVAVYGYQPFYIALPLGVTRTDEHGAYRFEDLCGVGRVELWWASPVKAPFEARCRSVTLAAGRHLEFRPVKLPLPGGEPGAIEVFSGKVLAGNGTPIAGAFLRVLGAGSRLDPSCFTMTGVDGSFSLALRSGTAETAQLYVGSSRLIIEHEKGVEKLVRAGAAWQLDLTGERTIQCDDLVMAEIEAGGAEGIELAWNLGGTFVPCLGNRAPALKSRFGGGQVEVRATAPGHLPRTGSSKISFAGDRPLELRVVDDAGDPVARALVDICARGRRFEEQLLQTIRADASGRIELLGPADADVVVYAYAEGCDPARARWIGGDKLQMRLRRRTGRLRLKAGDAESAFYVRRAGTFDIAAVRYLWGEEGKIDVVPGIYEVTRYANGPAAAAESVTVVPDPGPALELEADRRPRVTVEVPALEPDAEWWAQASRSAAGGMVAKWKTYSTKGGPMPRRELVAEVQSPGPRRFCLILPTSGRYTIYLGHKKLDGMLFREIDVRFGWDYALVVPSLTGRLKGEMVEFPKLWEWGGQHGIAGPRLCLEPAGATPFGLLVTLPEPKEFELQLVPAGTYTLYHHLYQTGVIIPDSGTFGGSKIAVLAGGMADTGLLARGAGEALEVRVLAGNGAPATGVLSVRDRMRESFQAVLDQNTTLALALDPIPVPPSARLADGKARLAGIQAGRLSFVLHIDDGRAVYFTRDVSPGTPLEAKLAALPEP